MLRLCEECGERGAQEVLKVRVGHELGPYILGLWTAVRWIIATLTSIAVIGLIYHHGVPRTQPWHRVLPGSVLATVLWFVSTVIFGVYLRRFANYDVIYGSVATAIALMSWLYLVSMAILEVLTRVVIVQVRGRQAMAGGRVTPIAATA